MNRSARTLRLPLASRPFRRPFLRFIRLRKKQAAIAALLLGAGGTFAALSYLRLAPLPPGAALDPSRVFSRSGEPIGDLVGTGITRQEIPLDQIPIFLQEATIAVEDAQFYSHSGLNLRGILRALAADLKARRIVQGGSTITQQLAKNLFLSGERTWWRKIREAVYALQLELHFPKQKILADYLNTVYYGDGATGVAAAAEYYFGKSAQNLDLAECALLAGLPKGPGLYSPYVDLARAKARQQDVLNAMVRTGSLTLSAARKAGAEPLRLAHRPAPQTLAPYFTDAVSRMAQSRFGLTRDDLYRGGLMIRTTLDAALQRALNGAAGAAVKGRPGLEIAAVVMDAATGDVKAYAGGADYRTSPYDRAQAMRQPGSTFKPFVFAAALDRGLTAAWRMRSAPTVFRYDGGREYRVHNFADIYPFGLIDMKQAIARSDNVFAVGVSLRTGLDAVIETAKRVGIPSDMKPYPSLALGVFPVSPLQMARAYAVFANGGRLVKPRMIRDISDPEGHVLYRADPQVLQVESPATCSILTDMLQSVMRPGGTGYRVAKGLPPGIAAKTGTTDTDAWMVGYTPKTVCAVWMGYDRPRPLDAVESHLPARVFATVMQAAAREEDQGTFPVPTDVTAAWIDPQTGQLATPECPVRERDLFASGTEPSVTCAAHPAPQAAPADRIGSMLRSLWRWFTGAPRPLRP